MILDEVILVSNAAAFVFHLALAVLSAVMGNMNKTFPLYWPKTVFDDSGSGSNNVSIEYAGEFPLTILFVFYFCITCFSHFGNCFLWTDTYFKFLDNRMNPLRWIEYSMTAPIMTTIIAFIAGTRNFLFLIAAAIITFSTISFGFIIDATHNVMFLLSGLVPFLVEFGLIIGSLYATTACRPAWVEIAVYVELLLWSFFPFISFLQLQKIVKYKHGELMFIAMSFASKAVLLIIMIVEGNVLKNDVKGSC